MDSTQEHRLKLTISMRRLIFHAGHAEVHNYSFIDTFLFEKNYGCGEGGRICFIILQLGVGNEKVM